jgi:hypothetical protein
MKAKVHADGKRRITMKLEAAVDAETLTMYALHMVSTEPNLDPVDIIVGANKREIFALARANIEQFGKDTAKSEVPSKLNPIQIKKAEDHVRSVFPEID